MFEKKPCRGCMEIFCMGRECPRWQVWFFEAWERFNEAAWQEMDRRGRALEGKFVYELPHMRRSPCVDCRCETWCDRVCTLRARWWDEAKGGVNR